MLIFLSLKKSSNFFFILISFIMFFFCLYLYFTNKKLKKRVSKLEIETKEILARKIVKENPSDLISIENISLNIEAQEKKEQYSIKNDPKSEMNPKTEIKEYQNNIMSKKKNRESTENYSRYEVNSINTMEYPNKSCEQRSIEHVSKESKVDITELTNQPTSDTPFNFYEFIQKDKKNISQFKENNKTRDYLEELSQRIEAEIKPQTVELTEYEKNQEDQAVISYQELLSLKNRLENQSEEDENSIFIDELKRFRNYLN